MHVYGSPRTHRELLNRGYEVCENTVAKLMNSEGIASSTTKKFRVNTTDSKHSLPIANNILDRDFTADGPGQKVVSDLTYITTAEGFLYLVCMIDIFSRRVVGWSLRHGWDKEIRLEETAADPSKQSTAATDFPAHIRLSLDELLLSRARLRFA